MRRSGAVLLGGLAFLAVLPRGRALSQEKVRAEAEFERLLALPGGDTPFGRVQLALWALEHGLPEKAWSLADPLAERGLEPPGWKSLEQGALALLLEKVRDRPTPRAMGRALLFRTERPGPALEGFMGRALAVLLEEERAKGKSSGKRSLAALVRHEAEEGPRPWIRRTARRALLLSCPKDREFVYRMAVRYPAGPTRRTVLGEISALRRVEGAARYLGDFMNRTIPGLRLRAARVLGDLASPAALPALREARTGVARTRARLGARAAAPALDGGGGGGGGSPRAYIAILTQYSYVKDFDAQVAQSAMIADPKTGTVSDGAVLDVKVLNVEIVRYLATLDRTLLWAIRRCSARRNAGPGK